MDQDTNPDGVDTIGGRPGDDVGSSDAGSSVVGSSRASDEHASASPGSARFHQDPATHGAEEPASPDPSDAADDATPLSSALHIPVLLDDPAPLSSALGIPTLVDDDDSSASPDLHAPDDPAPLSSALHAPTLLKEHDGDESQEKDPASSSTPDR